LSLAFLFDLDGVIVDSMPLHIEVWIEYLEQYGIDGTRLVDRMHGKRNDDLVRDLFGSALSPEEVHRHGAAKEALFRDRIAGSLDRRLVPGVREFLDRKNTVPKAVGSNAERANVDFVLERSGLAGRFRVTVSGDQVERPKPHPDIYFAAARALGKTPAECIVFEDSPTGVAAARAAGMRVVGVDTARAGELDADLRIADFLSPDLERWLSTQQPGTR
jgi:HAD superfamily hydrolase (TIGR01509 family)